MTDDDGGDAEPDRLLSDDEVAGVVDAFGALRPAELRRALSELAYRRGVAVDPDDPAVERTVTHALGEFRLLTVDETAVDVGPAASDDDAEECLVVGPSAFPELPRGGDDLPHVLDVDPRTVDRDAVTEAAVARVRGATEALLAGVETDPERAATLRELTYDVEALGDVDLGSVRERLDDRLDEG